MTFREARQRAGLTVRDVAKIMHCTETAVFYWESGQHAPVATKLPKLARLYGVSIDELLEGRNGGAA